MNASLSDSAWQTGQMYARRMITEWKLILWGAYHFVWNSGRFYGDTMANCQMYEPEKMIKSRQTWRGKSDKRYFPWMHNWTRMQQVSDEVG